MSQRALKAYVFYCANHLEGAPWPVWRGIDKDDAIKMVSLPCSGKVDIPYLIKAFETGADGVAIVTCKRNECRHFEGNLRAHKRAEGVKGLLEEIGMAGARIAVFECGQQDAGAVLGEIQRFMEQVRNLPLPPARDDKVNRPENVNA